MEKVRNKIPPKFHQRWLEAFENYLLFYSKSSWEEFCNYSDYEDILCCCEKKFKTGISDDTTQEILKLMPNHKVYCPVTCFEVVDIDEHLNSNNFLKSKLEVLSDIDSRSNIEEIWLKKFHILAKYTKKITIIDRFLFDNIREDLGGRVETSIYSFIKFLSRYNKRFNITIISRGSGSNSAERDTILNYFNRDINNANFKNTYSKIELICKSNHFFTNYSHDRFITFDKYVCDIGVGFEIFRKRPIPQTTFKMVVEENSSIEKRILKAKDHPLWLEEILPITA